MVTFRKISSLSRQAFSLVELVLAIGITVIVLSILLALLGLGVQTAADSQADSIGSLIAENIRAELLADPDDFRNITPSDSAEIFFTGSGERILPGDDEADARYVARLRLYPENETLSSGDDARYRFWEWSPRDGNANNAHSQRLFIEIYRSQVFNQDGQPFTTFSLVRALPPAN
ncbi:MAG: hypothetical protein JJT75_07620 [Opitutales bacterium]|nr:hypothetical protein [Opitutales bacterium]MCH8541403.1 hypothetical protein [Opitutales bacterium]